MIVYLVIIYIDDSNGQGYEEEGDYYEEEAEENFNHLSNQGKLNTCSIYLQANTCNLRWQANTCMLPYAS